MCLGNQLLIRSRAIENHLLWADARRGARARVCAEEASMCRVLAVRAFRCVYVSSVRMVCYVLVRVVCVACCV